VKVLFVDDDPAATRLYRAMLTDAGHTVMTLDSGVDAVEAAGRDHFDVVVTDFNMPGIKGDVTLSLLRARDPRLPVILLTSDPTPVLERQARHAGAALLRKPCSAAELLRTLARVARK
jgi:two-component system response regulator FlrC